MAEQRLVRRAVKLTAALSIFNIMFSGGCAPVGSVNTRAGGYRDGELNGVGNYSGENASVGPQISDDYQEMKEWNFNSRMNKRSSANRNPAGETLLSDEQVLAQVQEREAPRKTKTYQYYNPSDPRADQDGFVSIELPDDARPVAKQQKDYHNAEFASDDQFADNDQQFSGYSSASKSNSGYDNRQLALNDVESRYRPESQQRQMEYQPVTQGQQYRPDQPALPPLPAGINPMGQPESLNGGYAQPADGQPLIKAARVTGITVNGQLPANTVNQTMTPVVQQPNMQSTGGAVNSWQQTPATQPSLSSNQGYYATQSQPSTNGYALPRLDSNPANTPVFYAGGNTTPQATINNQLASMPVNNVQVTPDTKVIRARAEYAPALQAQAGITNVDELAVNLERLLRNDPDNVDLQMALRYAYAARGEHDRALQELDMIPIEKQRDSIALARATILSSQLTSSNDPMVANSALSAIRSLQDKIANKADLKISTFKVCSRVDNFGQYQEIAKNYLEAGNACEVLIYCELENYQYLQDDEGKYSTSLHAEITLFDSSLNVLQQVSDDVVDTPSYNKRKDFFLRGPFKIPQLKAGKYQIVISMEDKVAGKRALAARYNFEVKGRDFSTGSELTN
ncbi:MAG: hypothetical protein JW745_08840 [Sedimentisphaerales bacterium]|nr:hypothetical protein [Sedimentisphaerales bacterium]MBN2843756.1 hypothetical protein [Sedimentisphaerales bacterium]